MDIGYRNTSMTELAENYGNVSLPSPYLKKIIRTKILRGQEGFVYLHKSIDVYDENDEFLVGLRPDFLKPGEVDFIVEDFPEMNAWRVSLKSPPKYNLSFEEEQPLETRTAFRSVIGKYTRRYGNQPYPVHRWPSSITRKENTFLCPNKMVRFNT